MTKRQKSEISPTLKAGECSGDTEVQLVEPMEVVIKSLRDISTAHGEKLVADVENSDSENYSVFINQTAQNTLIEAFGEDDSDWLNKSVILSVQNAPEPFQKQKMIVVEPKEE